MKSLNLVTTLQHEHYYYLRITNEKTKLLKNPKTCSRSQRWYAIGSGISLISKPMLLTTIQSIIYAVINYSNKLGSWKHQNLFRSCRELQIDHK